MFFFLFVYSCLSVFVCACVCGVCNLYMCMRVCFFVLVYNACIRVQTATFRILGKQNQYKNKQNVIFAATHI